MHPDGRNSLHHDPEPSYEARASGGRIDACSPFRTGWGCSSMTSFKILAFKSQVTKDSAFTSAGNELSIGKKLTFLSFGCPLDI